MTDPDKLKKAKQKVLMKKAWYYHLIIFFIINAILFFINAATGGPPWFFIPIISWALGGLLPHYLIAFGLPAFGILTTEWEQKQLDAELRKLEAKKGKKALPDGASRDEMDERLELKELQKEYDDEDLV